MRGRGCAHMPSSCVSRMYFPGCVHSQPSCRRDLCASDSCWSGACWCVQLAAPTCVAAVFTLIVGHAGFQEAASARASTDQGRARGVQPTEALRSVSLTRGARAACARYAALPRQCCPRQHLMAAAFAGIVLEQELRRRIETLQAHRRNGLRSLQEVQEYEKAEKQRATDNAMKRQRQTCVVLPLSPCACKPIAVHPLIHPAARVRSQRGLLVRQQVACWKLAGPWQPVPTARAKTRPIGAGAVRYSASVIGLFQVATHCHHTAAAIQAS